MDEAEGSEKDQPTYRKQAVSRLYHLQPWGVWNQKQGFWLLKTLLLKNEWENQNCKQH